VDIDAQSLCIDPAKIEAAITERTKAIMAVHVFGNPCDVEAIDKIAKKHNLKVIYDGAHAFGVVHKGKSLLSYGDISICSFHATKLFHTIEGGCIVSKDAEVNKKVDLLKRFGHTGDEHFILGINAKANEFQAAMGLCNLPYVSEIIQKRKKLHDVYESRLGGVFQTLSIQDETEHNYGYYPIVFSTKELALKMQEVLSKKGIFTRRYFYPSLNTLPYLESTQVCPVSEDIAERILCLPLYYDLEISTVNEISDLLLS
jgi:dTDP-4-amino-4,6-dideoxygalactose transaminase